MRDASGSRHPSNSLVPPSQSQLGTGLARPTIPRDQGSVADARPLTYVSQASSDDCSQSSIDKGLSQMICACPTTLTTWSWFTAAYVEETRAACGGEYVCLGICSAQQALIYMLIQDILTVPWKSRGAALLYYTGDDIVSPATPP